MERVAGPDLYDYITQHPSFNANQEERRFIEATRLFGQMIDAVAHIHALKAYHRDLKPENFILGADGNLKLTDFGLATRESLSTDFECGSKPYMSYENRNGGLNPKDPTVYGPRDDYSPRLSDVWALGVLFLNLLFAQSPWTDPSRESCFKFCRFLREGAGFLVSQFPKLPREVGDFLVTRIFSPESGRCNVLELKQWVQDLGYPFNLPKSGSGTVSRPISTRHKNVSAGRRPANTMSATVLVPVPVPVATASRTCPGRSARSGRRPTALLAEICPKCPMCPRQFSPALRLLLTRRWLRQPQLPVPRQSHHTKSALLLCSRSTCPEADLPHIRRSARPTTCRPRFLRRCLARLSRPHRPLPLAR
ncbi:kinase-like domain-containing protein [Kickxella alabastrina]|uniref:kinase-like domain-containing protein n=1 Tax=Kickxella alabastrina TaxID=61397 RepID=UPI00221E7447|nr:kinase-like domain-containing protein [Kickxella alabastrina]KAI7827325.1 kinase-like domain-containing protein [Kickxella alabastrina]